MNLLLMKYKSILVCTTSQIKGTKKETEKQIYNRKKNAWKAKKVSGRGLNDVKREEKAFKEYSFMAWLDSYIKPRNTTTNFVDDDNESEVDDNISIDEFLREDGDENYVHYNPDTGPSAGPSTGPGASPGASPFREDIEKTEPGSGKRKLPKKETIKSREINLMQGMETIIQRRLNSTSSSEEDGDSIFGKMLSSELKNFDEDDKFEMKHEMYNIIYKYKLARRDKSRFEAAIAHTSSHIPAKFTHQFQSNTTSHLLFPLMLHNHSLLPPMIHCLLFPLMLHNHSLLPHMIHCLLFPLMLHNHSLLPPMIHCLLFPLMLHNHSLLPPMIHCLLFPLMLHNHSLLPLM